jgi:hypothetical protein
MDKYVIAACEATWHSPIAANNQTPNCAAHRLLDLEWLTGGAPEPGDVSRAALGNYWEALSASVGAGSRWPPVQVCMMIVCLP